MSCQGLARGWKACTWAVHGLDKGSYASDNRYLAKRRAVQGLGLGWAGAADEVGLWKSSIVVVRGVTLVVLLWLLRLGTSRVNFLPKTGTPCPTVADGQEQSKARSST